MNHDNEKSIALDGMVTAKATIPAAGADSSSTTANISAAKSADNVSSSKASLQVILLPYYIILN